MSKAVKQMHVGDRVKAGKNLTAGTVRFIGETRFAKDIWVGIELDAKEGKNDGCVQGVRYFKCPPMHGIFVKPDYVRHDAAGGGASSSPRDPRDRPDHRYADDRDAYSRSPRDDPRLHRSMHEGRSGRREDDRDDVGDLDEFIHGFEEHGLKASRRGRDQELSDGEDDRPRRSPRDGTSSMKRSALPPSGTQMDSRAYSSSPREDQAMFQRACEDIGLSRNQFRNMEHLAGVLEEKSRERDLLCNLIDDVDNREAVLRAEIEKAGGAGFLQEFARQNKRRPNRPLSADDGEHLDLRSVRNLKAIVDRLENKTQDCAELKARLKDCNEREAELRKKLAMIRKNPAQALGQDQDTEALREAGQQRRVRQQLDEEKQTMASDWRRERSPRPDRAYRTDRQDNAAQHIDTLRSEMGSMKAASGRLKRMKEQGAQRQEIAEMEAHVERIRMNIGRLGKGLEVFDKAGDIAAEDREDLRQILSEAQHFEEQGTQSSGISPAKARNVREVLEMLQAISRKESIVRGQITSCESSLQAMKQAMEMIEDNAAMKNMQNPATAAAHIAVNSQAADELQDLMVQAGQLEGLLTKVTSNIAVMMKDYSLRLQEIKENEVVKNLLRGPEALGAENEAVVSGLKQASQREALVREGFGKVVEAVNSWTQQLRTAKEVEHAALRDMSRRAQHGQRDLSKNNDERREHEMIAREVQRREACVRADLKKGAGADSAAPSSQNGQGINRNQLMRVIQEAQDREETLISSVNKLMRNLAEAKDKGASKGSAVADGIAMLSEQLNRAGDGTVALELERAIKASGEDFKDLVPVRSDAVQDAPGDAKDTVRLKAQLRAALEREAKLKKEVINSEEGVETLKCKLRAFQATPGGIVAVGMRDNSSSVAFVDEATATKRESGMVIYDTDLTQYVDSW